VALSTLSNTGASSDFSLLKEKEKTRGNQKSNRININTLNPKELFHEFFFSTTEKEKNFVPLQKKLVKLFFVKKSFVRLLRWISASLPLP